MMKRNSDWLIPAVTILAFAVLGSCGTHKKLSKIEDDSMAASLALTQKESFVPQVQKLELEHDSLIIHDESGKEVLIMKAVKDEESGEMVAHDVIDAAVVTARFRNVAERQGKVDLKFQITVPASLQDSKWQLRFYPEMTIFEESTKLDSVIVTGNTYRKSQIRGRQQYDRFLKKMMADSSLFSNVWQLELFIKRYLPEVYKFKDDDSFVDDETFESCFDIKYEEVIAHYNHRDRKRKQMYDKFSKKAIITEGVRLDTVMQAVNGDFIYNYTQTINSRPKLRKADIVLSGAIFEGGERIYTMPTSDPLTFYISSISAFTDISTHYKYEVVWRQAEANDACRIDFEVGKSDVQPQLGENAGEISRIKGKLRDLLNNDVFDMDSITVDATASPEGSYQANASLAQRRSESVSDYFRKFINGYRDSLKREEGIVINLDETVKAKPVTYPEIKFISHSTPENWVELQSLIHSDTTLTDKQKDSFDKLMDKFSDPDKRELSMKGDDYYSYVRSNLYPKLRTVRFNFFLHRRGMVKDTVHTTVVDSLYMEGVQALKDMDYERALEIFRPYEDFNAAVAYTAMNRNMTALDILNKLERSAPVNYMLSIVYSRLGKEAQAVECYVRSCQQDQSFVYRGNLDPEISVLIKKYDLNKEPEDDLSDLL